MARTALTPERLVGLAAEGRDLAGRSPFVNPTAVETAKRLLHERGEDWAGSVLMRDLSRRRALIDPNLPWLNKGEMETLLLAARAEEDELERAAQAADGVEGDLG